MTCPDCGKDQLVEEVVEREFQFGHKNPVMLKAEASVEICKGCGLELHGWQMEKAQSLARSAYCKERHDYGVTPSEEWRIGHAASSRHRKQLEHEGKAGCFYCLRFFEVEKIEEWIDDGQTALCPMCGIDSVIPETREVTPQFLKEMQQFWFDAATVV